ncbi:ATP-binding protein [Lipingzhangella rawalii]|uniref:ATP-binding protein n=1 Tax=Lipingzhangella rawalii TaxID=2055835 RepID=UPI00287B9982|nr:ATP-binding protein [Lipingzhangella rawalii]
MGHTCARWHLEADLRSVKIARELTLAVLREWDLTRIHSNVELVVSELVTNALRHAGGSQDSREDIELSVLSRDGQFVCAVRDTSDVLPAAREPDFMSESGRGLHLVACFSDRWGAVPSVPCGKFVWALFS